MEDTATEDLIPSMHRSYRKDTRTYCLGNGCTAAYQILIVSLLIAILSLQVTNYIKPPSNNQSQKPEGGDCSSNGIATLLKKLGPLDTSGLLETCGFVRPLPERLNSKEYRLKQVQVVIRHGDRTQWRPTPCWDSKVIWNCSLTMMSTPSFSRSDTTVDVPKMFRHYYLADGEPMMGDCSTGQLTVRGFHQEVLNGMYLRQAYIDSSFLNSTAFDKSEIYIRSDDVHRTIQSAEGVLYGMYPPNFCTQQPVDVIDIHMVDINNETISPNAELCPKYADNVNKSQHSPEYMDHYANITEPLLRELGQILNTSLTADDLDPIVDCFTVHRCNRFQLPPGVDDSLIQRTANELTWGFNYAYTYPSLEGGCTAAIGYLAKEIHDRIQNFTIQKDLTKFVLYSGHDTTLLPLLNLFQLASNDGWPPYASRLTLELYERIASPQDYVVRILYNGDVMQLPFCKNFTVCSWTSFSLYLLKFVPKHDFCFS